MKFGNKMLAASSLALVLSVNLFAQDVYTIQNKTLQEALEIISKKSNLSYIADDKLLESEKKFNLKNVEGLNQALLELLIGTGLKAIVKEDTIVIIQEKSKVKNTQNNLEDVDVIVSALRSNITLDKSPVSVKIINQKEILEQLAITGNSSSVLSNLISSYSPSRQKMSGNGETIRGKRPLILIDGIPQSNPLRQTGREVHTLDFKMVKRIEIINGATATNGVAGVGGVINIITKEPENDKVVQTFDVQTTMPTSKIKSETASYKVGYSVGGKENDFDYYLSGTYENQGLYLDGNGDAVGVDNTQGDLMDSRSYDILAKLGYWIDDNQNIRLSVNKYNIKNKNNYTTVDGDKENRILTTSKKETPEGKAPYNDVLSTKISYDNDDFMGMKLSLMGFSQEFEGLFGATKSKSFQDINIAPIGTFYDQSRVKSSKYGTKMTLNKEDLLDNKLNITFGLDTLFDETFQDLYLTNRTYVPHTEYNVYSPFLLASYALTDDITVHMGGKYELGEIKIDSYTTVARYNNVFVEGGTINIKEFLFNAGLLYDFKNGSNIFASYSEGFTLPDVGRALRSINTSGVSLSAFENLKPIITDTYEVGYRNNQDVFNFEAVLFQSESEFGNRIEIDASGAYMLKREKTRIQGFDLALGLKVNETNNLNFLYTYMNGKYDSDKSGSLDKKLEGINIAPNRFIGKWSSSINSNLSTFVQVNHAFKKSFDDKRKEFSGYTLVDFSTSYKLKNDATVSLGISNLFDKQYVTYYSQSAVNDDSRYGAGRGRSVTLGYSVKF